PVGRRLQRIDDDWPVQAGLLLEQGMAVVPVRAGLSEGEAGEPALARGDAVEAHAGYPVHVGRQQQAMTVDGAGRIWQVVADADADDVALAPAQQRCRHRAVDRHGRTRTAGDVEHGRADGKVELATTEGGR